MVEEKSGFLGWLQRTFDRPASWYVEMAGYLVVGFIVGFLVKHAGRLFFLLLLGAGLAFWILNYFEIITVHYTILKNVLGVSADMTMQDFFTLSAGWIRSHIIESLAALFGFILAWKFA